MNPLYNTLPFRHQLLFAKMTNSELKDIQIPLLDKHVCDDPKLLAFIEKFCKLEGKNELEEGR